MLGNNPVEKSEITGDGERLRVVDGAPFYTIQGEGPFAGDAAVFLRLHGCPLRCFFCDTDFSNIQDPYVSTMWLVYRIQEMVPSWCKLLVITGGEPVRQNLSLIIREMVFHGWTVQVETAGILWQDCLKDTVIVCSPKTAIIQPKIHDIAHAFKYVIQAGEVDPEDGLPLTNTQQENGKPHRLARPRPGAPVYLSPMDLYDPVKNAANIKQVRDIAQKFPYRAAVQLHKILNVP